MYITAFITSIFFLGSYAKARSLSREHSTKITLSDTILELKHLDITTQKKRNAAFFDVDGTLYCVPGDSTGAATAIVTLFWITRASSIIKFSLVILSIPFLLVTLFLLDKTDRILSMFCMSNLQLVGVETMLIKNCMDTFVNSNEFQAMINTPAVERLNEHLAKGDLVIFISATPNQVTAPIANFFNVDIVCGSKCLIENGIVTRAQYQNTLLIGHQKEQLLKEILVQRYNIDLKNSYAYGDHVTDLPLLNLVGNPVAVNPTKSLEKIAVQNHWEIISGVNDNSDNARNTKNFTLLDELIFLGNNALFPSSTRSPSKDTEDVINDHEKEAVVDMLNYSIKHTQTSKL
jgi:HAD superfamily hydrolase (TIGR01490 family)